MDDNDWSKLHKGADTAMKTKSCPKCGGCNFHISRQCPLFKGAPVCISCCNNCEYHEKDPLKVPCRYYIENPQTNYAAEIIKLKYKEKHKLEQATRMYKSNKPWVGAKLEQEARWIKGQIKELEIKKELSESSDNPTQFE